MIPYCQLVAKCGDLQVQRPRERTRKPNDWRGTTTDDTTAGYRRRPATSIDASRTVFVAATGQKDPIELSDITPSRAVSEQVLEENVAICASTKRGLGSRAYNAGRLSMRREAGEPSFTSLLTTISLVTRKHEVFCCELRNLHAVGLTRLIVEPVVDATENATVCLLLCKIREAGKGASLGRQTHRPRVGDGKRNRVLAKHDLQRACRRGAQACCVARVRGIRWCRQQRRPGRIRIGRTIQILARTADRGDRPPQPICELARE